jgi:coproporphyrinogen III oxidase
MSSLIWFTTRDFIWSENNGRIESILMSLPPHTMGYDHHPEAEEDEEKLVNVLKPRDWV